MLKNLAVKSERWLRAVGISTGDSVMMGRQTGDQSQLFYMFDLEKSAFRHAISCAGSIRL